MSAWIEYEDGATIGAPGTEGGTIILDEEHSLGGRITLERDARRVPCAITAGVYGWMVHTRFFTDEGAARHAYGNMKADLENILHLLPNENADMEDYDALETAISDFVERFP